MLDDPGRVRSQITSVVCKIQRFDFDCNLVHVDLVSRKVIIRTRAPLRIKPLLNLVIQLYPDTSTTCSSIFLKYILWP
jgi:hypothetical protein